MTPHATRYRLAILDDDADLCSLLKLLLQNDYDIEFAADGAELGRLVDVQAIDLILLDIGLPQEDGISIAQRIRSVSAIPIVFLSGYTAEDIVVKGLSVGGYDYITKPFQQEVLLARIRNALQLSRANESRRMPAPAAKPLEISFDLRQQNLIRQDGRHVKLTWLEAQILSALSQAVNRTLTRDEISQRMHGRNWEPHDRSLEVHIYNLRKKLSRAGSIQNPIGSIRGVGYQLNLDLKHFEPQR